MLTLCLGKRFYLSIRSEIEQVCGHEGERVSTCEACLLATFGFEHVIFLMPYREVENNLLITC